MSESPAATLERTPWTRVGISRTTAYELISAGAFPAPVKIGRASRWVVAEVNAWIASRIAARNGGA